MIKFGPSGNSDCFYAAGFSHTEEAAPFVRERGLDCFEYSFGRGVRMSETKAIAIQEAFAAEGVEISVHAPILSISPIPTTKWLLSPTATCSTAAKW